MGDKLVFGLTSRFALVPHIRLGAGHVPYRLPPGVQAASRDAGCIQGCRLPPGVQPALLMPFLCLHPIAAVCVMGVVSRWAGGESHGGALGALWIQAPRAPMDLGPMQPRCSPAPVRLALNKARADQG